MVEFSRFSLFKEAFLERLEEDFPLIVAQDTSVGFSMADHFMYTLYMLSILNILTKGPRVLGTHIQTLIPNSKKKFRKLEKM